MNITTGLLFIAVTTLALSYGWGMRGTVIGGEKGAMLPGALLGLLLAWFTGSAVIRQNFWIFAAAGLMGMTFGGVEPYGETIGMVLHRGRRDYRPKWGTLGLSLKGAQWFSLCSGFISLSLAASTGSVYKWYDIVILCLLIPVIGEAGYRIFNKPYDKEKGIYPKIYFSLTRREEWGRNVMLIMALYILAAVRGDSLTLAMLTGGFVSGFIGWAAAIKMYVFTVFPMSNGKYLLGKISTSGSVDGWKTMEFTLGAIGGLGVSLCWWAAFGSVKQYVGIIEQNGGVWSPINHLSAVSPYLVAAAILGIIAVNVYSGVAEKRGKRVNSLHCDLIERPLYNVLPMLLVLLGDLFTARIMTFFMLFFVCAVKCAFDRYEGMRFLPLRQSLLMLASLAVFVVDILIGGYSAWQLWLLAGAPYLLAELSYTFTLPKIREYRTEYAKTRSLSRVFGGQLTVMPFFAAQIAVMYAVGYQIFM